MTKPVLLIVLMNNRHVVDLLQ